MINRSAASVFLFLAIAPAVSAQDGKGIIDWSGPYIGATVGAGGGLFTEPRLSASQTLTGHSLGIAGGYNWHHGSVLFGLEADYQLSSIDRSNSFSGVTTTTALKSMGSLRARLGVPLGPVLPYVTAGVALGEGKIWSEGLLGQNLDLTRWHSGPVIGAGVEVALTEAVSLKTEVLHYKFTTQRYVQPSVSVNSDLGWSATVARLGLNLRF
jgi:outer membrane immunogenic protein